MRIVREIDEMKEISDSIRDEQKTIAFVPTMGCLHKGHLELIRLGRKLSDTLVLSLFINPIQFGPDEDYETYPKDRESDIRKAEDESVDIIFLPDRDDLFPEGFQTFIEVRELSKSLCGKFRPGHFTGVATIVLKLFNIVRPHFAIFGEKDYQQLVIIKRMVSDLNMDVRIIDNPIVRESDGLACSSRNNYLTAKERVSAARLSEALQKARGLFMDGERDASNIIRVVKALLEADGSIAIEYIELCDMKTLETVRVIKESALLAVAARVGKTRLIDNCILGEVSSKQF